MLLPMSQENLRKREKCPQRSTSKLNPQGTESYAVLTSKELNKTFASKIHPASLMYHVGLQNKKELFQSPYCFRPAKNHKDSLIEMPIQ